ncbi:20225_t:CDS:2 [Entrophospora sp. SA101]|nr:20225_t:CDS:2 [Entrophospora sp. SA101]
MPEVCDPITQNGSHYIKWIHMLFGSCVYGNREAASLLLGFLSIACWLNAQSPNSLIIGRVISWMCTTLYLTSRMPQIWQNHQRKSVEGLSIVMFIFAALGNLTYTMSIFTNPLASSDPLFLIDKIPYILGSVGTLSFDVTIFLQWCVWKDRIRNDHQYPYRRARSATTHSYSSIGLSSSKRLSSSTHKLGYNTLPSNYHKTNFKKQLRSGAGSNDDIRRSIILTNGELFV